MQQHGGPRIHMHIPTEQLSPSFSHDGNPWQSPVNKICITIRTKMPAFFTLLSVDVPVSGLANCGVQLRLKQA